MVTLKIHDAKYAGNASVNTNEIIYQWLPGFQNILYQQPFKTTKLHAKELLIHSKLTM